MVALVYLVAECGWYRDIAGVPSPPKEALPIMEGSGFRRYNVNHDDGNSILTMLFSVRTS